ncbi:unnamed protein product [Echinostoma caproni]|uniref:IgGFc_binding domain-containing protein n=1 Tax=Echinostoma caproni TaxID=27848 RepID=A0A183ABP1_9TREM|nr:unnamed protein product [Echinostoma caproni]
MIPDDSNGVHFDITPENFGFFIKLNTERNVLISYKNTITQKKEQFQMSSSKQLTDLDRCTPYIFEGRFAEQPYSTPWQSVTIVTEPEVIQITEFKATGPMETMIAAKVVTSGYCALTYTLNGVERTDEGDRQFYGGPFVLRIRPETGAIITKVKNGYTVAMRYEIYGDPGCGKRILGLIPFAEAQVKPVSAANRIIDVGTFSNQ